jgi:hypothetical protein
MTRLDLSSAARGMPDSGQERLPMRIAHHPPMAPIALRGWKRLGVGLLVLWTRVEIKESFHERGVAKYVWEDTSNVCTPKQV